MSGIWPVFRPGLLRLTLRGAASIMQDRCNHRETGTNEPHD